MIDWQNIETVFLDMDGTLLDLHFDNYFWLHHLPRRYAEIHQQDPEFARETLIDRFKAEQGTLNWYCLDYWSEQLSVDILMLKKEIQHLICERPWVQDFLQRLHQSNRRVVLITNAHRDSLNLKTNNTEITPWFDALISSHDFGHPKEHQEFWQALEKTEPFNKQQTLFIDDSLSVLHSAKRFGIKYLLTLKQPDSKTPPRDITNLDFPHIHHFDEILPPYEQK